jgi:hypothetical protein
MNVPEFGQALEYAYNHKISLPTARASGYSDSLPSSDFGADRNHLDRCVSKYISHRVGIVNFR